MNEQPPRLTKEIYAIIAVGSIGFLFAIGRIITNRYGPSSAEQSSGDSLVLPLNNIIEGDTSLPISCKNALTIIDCTITHATGDKSSLNLYRQQITSERNITPKSNLENICSQQVSYMQSLSGANISCKSLFTK